MREQHSLKYLPDLVMTNRFHSYRTQMSEYPLRESRHPFKCVRFILNILLQIGIATDEWEVIKLIKSLVVLRVPSSVKRIITNYLSWRLYIILCRYLWLVQIIYEDNSLLFWWWSVWSVLLKYHISLDQHMHLY